MEPARHHPLGAGAFDWGGTTYRIILSAARTSGRQTMIDSVIRPGHDLPGFRLTDADESFVILSGDIEFTLGLDRFSLGLGQAGFAPRGIEHAFRVLGNKPARLITVLIPGGIEDFLQEMARRRFRLPEDLGQINRIGKRYSIEFTAPVQKGHA